ncbi:MAG: serine/threonine protein kinase, partial [Acidobacteria bacterium]|nr:serine/threonine protein kinase [Acidobacteriota bacterium]
MPDGTARLLDFGIARMASVQLTATGMVLGTPEYIAPEILREVAYSPRTDNYAVGLVAYFT